MNAVAKSFTENFFCLYEFPAVSTGLLSRAVLVECSAELGLHTKNMDVIIVTAAAAESLQSCPTLCDPTDGSPPGSAVPGILQARTLEWVAISSSNAGK